MLHHWLIPLHPLVITGRHSTPLFRIFLDAQTGQAPTFDNVRLAPNGLRFRIKVKGPGRSVIGFGSRPEVDALVRRLGRVQQVALATARQHLVGTTGLPPVDVIDQEIHFADAGQAPAFGLTRIERFLPGVRASLQWVGHEPQRTHLLEVGTVEFLARRIASGTAHPTSRW